MFMFFFIILISLIPDNNVEIGQGQLRLIVETYFVLPYMGVAAIFVK